MVSQLSFTKQLHPLLKHYSETQPEIIPKLVATYIVLVFELPT